MQPHHPRRPGSRALVHLACLLFACCDANWCLNAGSEAATGSESTTGGTTVEPDTETTTVTDPCGDGVCAPDEDSKSCLEDCPVSPPGCGDGEKKGSEACDDGEDNGKYGQCKTDCTGTIGCGDGEENGPEVCDDGASNSDDYAANAHCNADCSALAPYCGDKECQTADGESAKSCAKDCQPQCGNGVVEPGEDCDEVGGESATCDADCTAVMCGDSYANAAAGEDCDDGNEVDTDACIACKNALCGDGIVLAGLEECDDKNDKNDDACSNDCQKPRRMFVTSVAYKGNLGGLVGADEKCQMLANAEELDGTFIAWLSDGTDSPSTRLDTTFTGAYQLVNGAVIASDGWKDLTDGMLNGPININENKDITEENVWTNTAQDGTAADAEKHCANWSSSAGDVANKVTFGDSSFPGAEWTQYDVANCSTAFRLYCIEKP